MRLARLSLLLTALVFGCFGAWLFFWPQALALVDVELTTPAARIEIRAFYGGLELGLACFFAVAATRSRWYEAALFTQAAALGGMAAARLLGMLIEAVASPTLLMLLAAESGGSLLGIVALARLRSRAGAPADAPG